MTDPKKDLRDPVKAAIDAALEVVLAQTREVNGARVRSAIRAGVLYRNRG